jgi:hypothetical protein
MSLFKCCFTSQKRRVKPKVIVKAYDLDYYDFKTEPVLDPPTTRKPQTRLNENERPLERKCTIGPTLNASHRPMSYSTSKHWRDDPESYKYLTPFNAGRRKMM